MAINFVKNEDIKILRDIEQYYSTQVGAAAGGAAAGVLEVVRVLGWGWRRGCWKGAGGLWYCWGCSTAGAAPVSWLWLGKLWRVDGAAQGTDPPLALLPIAHRCRLMRCPWRLPTSSEAPASPGCLPPHHEAPLRRPNA